MFVSAIWVLSIFYAPQIISSHTLECLDDTATPLTCFFMLSGWSNIADIHDIEQDLSEGVVTPATSLGVDVSVGASVASAVLMFLSHSRCEFYEIHDVAIDACNLIAMCGTGRNILCEKK